MTDTVGSEGGRPRPKPRRKARGRPGWTRRWMQLTAAAITVVAAVVAALTPEASGAGGVVLLSGIAAAGMLLIFTIARGEASGRSLGPINAEADDRRLKARASVTAFETFPDPALITDHNGAPRFANEAYEALAADCGQLGDSGRPPGFDRVFGASPGVSAPIYRLSRAAAKGEALIERLLPAPLGADGAARAFDLEVTPMPGGGALWRAHERLRVKAAAEDGSGHEEPLLDQAPIGFFSASSEGKVLYMNETLKSWLGVEGPVRKLTISDFISGDAERAIGRSRIPGAPASRAEVVLKARDGIETAAVVVTSWPAGEGSASSRSVVFGLTASGAPAGVAQALAAPSAGELGGMLDAMFANAPFGVARLEGGDLLSAIIEDANPALLDLTGGAAAPGKAFADLFAMNDSARQALKNAGSGAAEPVELVLKQREGDAQASDQRVANVDEERVVHVYFAPERSGRKAAYVIDISAQKSFEQRFYKERRMRAIGDLAGGIAHDINNFLNIIRLSTDELLDMHPVGDPSYMPLQKINATVARGASLVRMLLAFARGQTMQTELCDLSKTMSEFSILLRHFIEESYKIETVYARELPYIKVDIGQLEAAILNLATNARDAMKDKGKGTLTLRTSVGTHEALIARGLEGVEEGQYAVIEVSDTGCGMSKATLEKIFQPFFTTKPVGKGTGLGLAMVDGIVRQSGGRVIADSVEGEGTTFSIYLPAYEPASEELEALREAERLAAQPKAKDHSGGGRILYVEDEAGLRDLTARRIRKLGYEVDLAEDGEEALEVLEENPGRYDLLITDVKMPEMDGPTLVRRAREYLGDAKVLFCSGFSKESFNDLLSNEREVSFMSKPFGSKEIAERIKSMIG
ncbi:MAG: ATP-binding protein [Maricaulaceae bacterium]|jgi:two-component system cell cycle sensor histidine kinase/response regulator CckA